MTDRRGRYGTGNDTRLLLIETAEQLFAQRGYDAVTLTEIRSAAGQNNASVIRYYFGSKQDLLRAVFNHRLPAVNAARDALIGERCTAGDALTVRDALWCLVLPLADSVRAGYHYVGLLDRLLETDILDAVFRSADPASTASGITIDRLMFDALTGLPEDTRRQRIRMVYESCLRTLARHARAGAAPDRRELSGLVDAWAGLLSAPLSDETADGRKGDRPAAGATLD